MSLIGYPTMLTEGLREILSVKISLTLEVPCAEGTPSVARQIENRRVPQL